jgi:hypothetical protein
MPTRILVATTTPAELPSAMVLTHLVIDACHPAVLAAASKDLHSSSVGTLHSWPTTKSAVVSLRYSKKFLQPSGLMVSIAQSPWVRWRQDLVATASSYGHSSSCGSSSISQSRSVNVLRLPLDWVLCALGPTVG